MRSQKEIEICLEILDELSRARTKFPNFPRDLIHRVAIVNEESGEAVQAAVQAMYEGGQVSQVREELIQTAAMCVRAIQSIDEIRSGAGIPPTELKWSYYRAEWHFLEYCMNEEIGTFRLGCGPRALIKEPRIVMGAPKEESLCKVCTDRYESYREIFRPLREFV